MYLPESITAPALNVVQIGMGKAILPLLALLGCLAAPRAHAESGGWSRPARQAESGPNAGMAFALSMAGTAVPLYLAYTISDASDQGSNQGLIMGLFLGGILLGPSSGQFYAGSWERGLAGSGILPGMDPGVEAYTGRILAARASDPDPILSLVPAVTR